MRSLLIVIGLAFLVSPVLVNADDGIDVSDQVKAFKEAMKSRDEDVRLKAVQEIAGTKHKDVASALVKYLRRDRSAKVQAEVARALGAQGDEKYARYLLAPLKKFDKMDPEVLLGYMEGLAGIPTRRGVEPLADMITKIIYRQKAEEQAIGLKATEALGKIVDKSAVEELVTILGLTDPRQGGGDGAVSDETRRFRGAFKNPVIEGLKHITGERFPTPEVWQDWWKKNERRWKPPEGEKDVNASDTYTNAGYKFRLKKPNGTWNFLPAVGENYIITLAHPQEGNPSIYDASLKVEAYSTSAYSGSNPSDRAVFYEDWARNKGGFKDVKESSTRDVKFAGESGKVWTCRGMYSNGAILAMTKYIFVHDGLLYTIHLQTLSGVPEQLQRDLEKAASSFRFTD